MFLILLFVSFLPPFLLYFVSKTSENGRLSGSAAHPYNILGFLLVVMNLNFLWAEIRASSFEQIYFARYSIGGHDELLQGMIYYVSCTVMITFGVLLAAILRVEQKQRYPLQDQYRAEASQRVFLLSLFAAGFASFVFAESALARGGLFYMAMMRQTFLSENTYLVPMYSLFVPAFIAWASYSDASFVKKILMALIGFVILLPIGSRSALLYIGLCLFVLFNIKITRLPALLLYLLSPLVVVVLIVLRYFRAYSGSGSFSEFLEVYEGRLLFGGADFQFAEPITFLVNNDTLPRYPFESIVAGFLAYVPRSLAPFKPEGPSAVFSMLADPERWQLVQSEWIIGGLANLYVENGPFFGPLLVLAVSFIWTRAFRMAAHSGSDKALSCAATLCAITGFLFLRTDIYNLSFFLWPVVLVLLFQRIFGGSIGEFKKRLQSDTTNLLKDRRQTALTHRKNGFYP
jgi:hypothetical protein